MNGKINLFLTFCGVRRYHSLLIAIIAILVYMFISIQMYQFIGVSSLYTDSYKILQAIGVMFFGGLSDYCSRRWVLLFIYAITLFSIIGLFLFPQNFLLIMVVGFFFTPLSIIRAHLIDSNIQASKVKLMAITFMAQMLPYCFYAKMSTIDYYLFTYLAIGFVCFLFLITFFFFFDRRHKVEEKWRPFSFRSMIHPTGYRGFFFTLIAFIPAQMVTLFTQNLPGNSYLHNEILSTGSIAWFLGVSIAILYRKTPHASVLTVTYGIGALLASMPIISIYIYHYDAVPMSVQLMTFICILSFELPFIYDLVLSSIYADYRGLICGLLEAFFYLTTIINFSLLDSLKINLPFSLVIILGLFFSSMMIQRYAE